MARLARWVIGFALLVAPVCARAASTDLYRAQVTVTGQGEASRGLGFALVLGEVLVKVSGDPRLIDDPRLTAIEESASELVTTFGFRDLMAGIPVHDEQGTRDRPYELTVSFRPERIDAALRSLGSEPWTAHRPRLVVFLAVRNGSIAEMLASDGERGRGMRDALLAAGRQFAMPVMLPESASLAELSISAATVASADLNELNKAAKDIGGDLALAGSLVWDEAALGWVARWRLALGNDDIGWQKSGVSFDEAFRQGIGGALQIVSGHGRPD
jgi:hypothetical protein